MTDGVKACSKCKTDYCLEEFYPRKERDGHSSWCKFCIRQAHNSSGKVRREQRRAEYRAGTLKPTVEKWCIICDDVKASEEFYLKWDSADLLSKYCRKCHVADDTRRKQIQRKLSHAQSS